MRKSQIFVLKESKSKQHYRLASEGIQLPPLIDASLILSDSFTMLESSFSHTVSNNKRTKAFHSTKRHLNPIPMSTKFQSTHHFKASLPLLDTSMGDTHGAFSFLTEPTTCLPTARLNDHP